MRLSEQHSEQKTYFPKTLSILEDYLPGFSGPILTVSHDRVFLDKLADTIFEVKGDGRVEQFTGNWTDWSQKRKQEDAPTKAEKPKAVQERPREKKLKFSYKEEREFATIEDDIAALEEKIQENQTLQAAAGSDYVKLQELQDQLTELEEQLSYKEERWMYLTELKEKIDAQGK